MRAYPSIPRISDAPAGFLERGHLWIQELVDGLLLRFSIDEAGHLRFGTNTTVFDDVPFPYRHAVRHVRETIDWSVLTADPDLVRDLVFFGVATTHQGVKYEWERTPSFLGHDVWSEDRQDFLPVDTVEKTFDRLALEAVPIFEKEQPAKYFSPDRYEMPSSRWYDGPPKGIVLRNKRGQRATMISDAFERATTDEPPDGNSDDPSTLATHLTTEDRIERARAALTNNHPDTEAVQQRVVELVFREAYPTIVAPGHPQDLDALASGIATQTRRYLREHAR